MIAKSSLLITINSIWLSKQQAEQMCNFGRLTADAPRGPKNALAQAPCPRRTQTCKQVTI